ncbi:hypothetical protein NP493_1733g00033 [Ridgeia piscesae]|uniref:Uncharacterized protein n=1 Tax=Ridgeia piscesae TaxID=27915 RepID=A0AAD9JTF5_RIDPI|nr:hypothetical protein NP493_1733g00033 [Ridgeia piscesae]
MADCLDWLLMLVGVLAAMIHGVAMPVAVYIFSQAVDIFVTDTIAKNQLLSMHFSNDSNAIFTPESEDVTITIIPICIRLVACAIAILAAVTVHAFCWKLTSERQVSRLRSQLFSSMLHQDCAWFDSHDTGSLTVTLTNNIVNVRSGMSDKVGFSIQLLSVLIVSFVMAMWINWRLTLAALTFVPIMTAFTIGIVIVTVKGTIKQGKAYEEAGSIAKEVLSAIRTVAAFGGESRDALRYNQCLFSARNAGIMRGILVGIMLGGIWCCHFGMAGLVNWYGTTLIVSEPGMRAGDVIFLLPNLEGIATAGGSAQIIFEIINTVSEGRTTIVVAHRLSTVRKADVIHCLSQGRLIESGSHDELMAREGLYYTLVSCHTESLYVNTLLADSADVTRDETSSSDVSDSLESKTKLKDAYEDDEQELREHHKLEGGHKSVFLRLLKLNAAEWPYLVIGCITSFVAGSIPPMFALVYGAMVKVGGNQLGLVATSTSSLVVSLGVALTCSWKLTVVNVLFMPLLVAAGYVSVKNRKENAARTMVMEEQGVKIASEAISNIRTVASLTVETKFERKFNSFFDSFVRVAVVLMKTSQAIGRSTAFAPDAHKARVAAKHIFNLLDRKPQIEVGDGDCMTPPECCGEVILDNVEFTYPSRPDAIILRGLTVTIKPGQRVALVGQSGCGKSTCVSLVERFYDTSRGCVRIDGVDIRSLDVQWVRAQLALVSQEPVLFNTTIYDNIAYGDNTRTPTMDEVIDVAKKANIHNFIASLPLGYDTNVGEGGSQLSGGQKQRIAIARALLRNPRILLLDEATSALDTESEKLVQEALERAQEGRTCIVIAHRLSTIRSADKIVVMQEGVVVEEGTHDELMAQKSFYCDLVQKQVDALVLTI